MFTEPRVDDATITASVRTKLVGDGAEDLVAVNVDTAHGVVQLKGELTVAQT